MDFVNKVNVTPDYVVFYGGPLSNFAYTSFVYDGQSWFSSEQCFMAQKAKTFHDIEMYRKICNAKTPQEAKRYGRMVKNYDNEIWNELRFQAMENAVYAKFSQDKKFKAFLLQDLFKDKHFAEGSPTDKIWGIGMDWRDTRVKDSDNWLGENLLGKVLDKVRERILAEA